MREIVLHYPITDNNKNPMHQYVQSCITNLAHTFGGATSYEVDGIWFCDRHLKYREHCRRVILAIDPEREQEVVVQFEIDLRLYGQLAMYWVDCNGEAHCDTLY